MFTEEALPDAGVFSRVTRAGGTAAALWDGPDGPPLQFVTLSALLNPAPLVSAAEPRSE